MRLQYVTNTFLNSACRGLLSLYLMYVMGPTDTGAIASRLAPLIFVSLLVTSFSTECYIRGSRSKFSGYRDRVTGLLIDACYLSGCLLYLAIQWRSHTPLLNDILVSLVLVGSAYGQISFNRLLDQRAWKHLAFANIAELIAHAVLLVTLFKGNPAGQFVCLAFSRWLFMNLANGMLILQKERFVLSALMRAVNRYASRLAWVAHRASGAHLANIALKTLWTTMDVYLIGIFWTLTDAGNYRFVKSLGTLPSLAFGPMWTVHRNDIQDDWRRGKIRGAERFSTVIRFSLRFSVLLPVALLVLWLLHEMASQLVSYPYEFTVATLLGFSMWWLISSSFGWVRYFMVALNRFNLGNRQSLLIVCLMLLMVPLNRYVDPEVMFPAIVLASNFVFVYYIRKIND